MQLDHLTEVKKQSSHHVGGERLLERFRDKGITIAEWAKQRGYNPQLVYMIARGERKCLRGKSFQIAKEMLAM